MPASDYSATPSARAKRKRPFPFGLVMLGFGFIIGTCTGVWATRKIYLGPDWIQKASGLASDVAAVRASGAPAALPAPASTLSAQPTPAQPASVAAPTSAAPETKPKSDEDASKPDESAPTADKPDGEAAKTEPRKPARPAEVRDLTGIWETTDKISSEGASGPTVTSAYQFKDNKTGVFESGGKKLYDFRWKPVGDDIEIVYDGEGPEPGKPWAATLRWTLNADRTVLTLIPGSGKDARAFLYSLSAGVYHKR